MQLKFSIKLIDERKTTNGHFLRVFLPGVFSTEPASETTLLGHLKKKKKSPVMNCSGPLNHKARTLQK